MTTVTALGRRGADGGRQVVVAIRLDGPQVEDDPPGVDPRDDGRPAPTEGVEERVGAGARPTATPNDGSVSPGSDPPPTVASVATTSAPSPRPAASASARARSPSASAAIIRHTGTSVSALPARYRPSVAATAASVTLSGRIARASGSRRSRPIRSARPTTRPAWGPPTSLSPLNVTTSAPAASRSDGIGSWASPYRSVGRSAPEPRSSTTIAPCAWASAASAAASGASVNPSWRKFDGWTRSTSAGPAVLERTCEVRDARPVRRPDLDQSSAGPAHDLGNAHAAADLDELAARDGDAAATPGEADGERQRLPRCCS